MSNNKERKIPDYLKFPFERYILVRVEFLILTQNELEAKIMRIIEWAIESKRDELSRKGLEVPDEVWVTIPESIFMDWLYGTVQSETTLKAAIKSIIKKYLVFKRPSGTGRYDALEYTLNKPLISKLFTLFPEKINDVDMASVMKQPRKSKDDDSEGQKLTPSKIDPLIRSIREAIIDPLNRQLLTPSEGQKLTPSLSLREGQKLTPENKEKENEKVRMKVSDHAPTLSLASFSEEDLLAELSRRQKEQSSPSETPSQETQHTQDGLIQSTPQQEKPSSEITRVKGYWKQMGYREEKSAAWAELGTETKTFEEFKSLFDFTAEQLRKDTKITNKEVHPGNMLNYLNAWKQDKKRREQPPESKPQASKPYVRDLAAEHRKMVEEMKSKIAASSKK